MYWFVSYRRFGRSRSLCSDRAVCMFGRCIVLSLDCPCSDRHTRAYMWLVYICFCCLGTACVWSNRDSNKVFLRDHLYNLSRKEIHTCFCRGLDINFVVTVFNPNKQFNGIDRQQHGNTDRQQPKRSDQQPPMPYRVRLPDLDAHRLKETRNLSQTSVCLRTTEKISQQSAEAPEQKQSTIAETSFVESVDQRHLPRWIWLLS